MRDRQDACLPLFPKGRRRSGASGLGRVNFDYGTNVIDMAVRRLRGKLDAPFERPLLHTVRGMGYVLEERGE